MILPTLPLVLYILPAVTVLTLLIPPKRKPIALALGGLCCVWMTGGFPALTLLMSMIVSAWLVLRLLPVLFVPVPLLLLFADEVAAINKILLLNYVSSPIRYL